MFYSMKKIVIAKMPVKNKDSLVTVCYEDGRYIQRREIAKGLRELEAAGLIRRERKKGEPNIIYVTDIIDYKNLTNN